MATALSISEAADEIKTNPEHPGPVTEEVQIDRLLRLGYAPNELARLTNSTTRSINRWRKQQERIRKASVRESINDLYTIISRLLSDGTYSAEDVVLWTRTRLSLLRYERPLDELSNENGFTRVLAAADVLLHPELRAKLFGRADTAYLDLRAAAPDELLRAPVAEARGVYTREPEAPGI